MSEAPAIGLGIVVVAIVAVLAGGAASKEDAGAGSSASDTPAPAGTRSAGPCTGLDTVTDDDGAIYTQYPVSASNSLGCTLGPPRPGGSR